MQTLVFLPATDPNDKTYGVIPDSIPEYPELHVRSVSFPGLVWYNESVQQKAVNQILSWDISDLILIGFGKSGLGVWNITKQIPELVSATIIFDSPVARDKLPTWRTQTFYSNDEVIKNFRELDSSC